MNEERKDLSQEEQGFVQKISWWDAQFLKVKSFAGIVIALILDALLILAVWVIRRLIILIIGIDPSAIPDQQLFWVVRLSELGTIVILAVYIVSDIVRHLLQAYEEIKRDVVRIFSRT